MEKNTILLGGSIVVLLSVYTSFACNEHVCASLVSKCLLLKSCECDMSDKKNCTCCKECHKCLARLYTECCSCVGMCPDHSNDPYELKSSTVEELNDPLPELFKVLTEEDDPYLRWTTFTYPAHLDLLYFKPAGHDEEHMNFATNLAPDSGSEHRVRHGGHHVLLDPASRGTNCTVAYMATCSSLGRCRASCQSMGAARYRWFHAQGCCECIGSTCLDFGKGEPHCLKCPAAEDEDDDENYDDVMDNEYGFGTGSEDDNLEADGDVNYDESALEHEDDEEDGDDNENEDNRGLEEEKYGDEVETDDFENRHHVYGLEDIENQVGEVRRKVGGV